MKSSRELLALSSLMAVSMAVTVLLSAGSLGIATAAGPTVLHPETGSATNTPGANTSGANTSGHLPGAPPATVESKRGVKATALPPPPGTSKRALPAAKFPAEKLPAAKAPWKSPPGAKITPRKKAAAGLPPAKTSGAFVVLGSFSEVRQARCFAAAFRAFPAGVAMTEVGGIARYRVVAPSADRQAAESLRAQAKSSGVSGAWILAACESGASGCLDRQSYAPLSPGDGKGCPQSASAGG